MPGATELLAAELEANNGRLDFTGQKKPIDLPVGICAKSLCLKGCDWLEELPADLACYELDLRETRIRRLPSDLRVRFRLDLEGCTLLEEMPADFECGSIVMRGCTSLRKLPDGLHVNFLDLRGCSGLSEWPSGIRIRRRAAEPYRVAGELPLCPRGSSGWLSSTSPIV